MAQQLRLYYQYHSSMSSKDYFDTRVPFPNILICSQNSHSKMKVRLDNLCLKLFCQKLGVNDLDAHSVSVSTVFRLLMLRYARYALILFLNNTPGKRNSKLKLETRNQNSKSKAEIETRNSKSKIEIEFWDF